jgi:Ca2+/Na+ antiporter
VKVQSRFDRLVKWLRDQATLRRAWYVYFLALAIFVIVSYNSRNLYWIQIGISLFAIAIVYLVMITSNKELKETTEKQVKAFVDNLQTVCVELRNVGSGINNLSNIMKEVQKTIMESTLASKTLIAKEEEEKKKRKESIRPQLLVRVEQRGTYLWVFGDWRHYWLSLWNNGSDAERTIIQIGSKTYGTYDIGTFKQQDIDIGHINEFKGISTLNIDLIEVRDIDRNRYHGQIMVTLPQPQWTEVSLIET